jgi:hypothetical protein
MDRQEIQARRPDETEAAMETSQELRPFRLNGDRSKNGRDGRRDWKRDGGVRRE